MLDPRRSSGKLKSVPVHSSSALRRYMEAVAIALAAVAIAWLMRDTFGGLHGLLFWVLSVVIAWRGGFGPVVLASIIAVVLRDFVLTSPSPHRGGSVIEVFSIVNYLGVSATLGYTVDTLRRARRRVAQATDGMIDAMLVFDAKWRLRFYNKAGITLLDRLGVKARRTKRRVLWDTVPAWIGTPFETESRRAQAEQRVVEYEARHPDADFWLQMRVVPTADGGVSMFAHDATVKQRAEADRRRTEERYRALVEASTVLVWNADSGGAVNEMPVWRELTGQSTAELHGTGWLDAIHPDDRTRVSAQWGNAVEEERPYTAEYRILGRDGSYLWYRARAVPLRENGQITEWVGVLDDIQEEHLARERHQAVENALGVLGVSLDYEWNLAAVTRMLVPTLADYCSIDLVDASGELRRVSSTHVDPEKEVVLRDLWKKYPYRAEDSGPPYVVRTGVAQINPRIDPEEIVRYARSKEQAAMMAHLGPRSYLCVPMSSRGQVFGALALVYSDSGRVYGPTEQVAVEQIATRAATAIENARLYADAQAANRTKSDFLATMSHELRTPLNAIAGYAELLLMGVRGPISEDQRRDLLRIKQNQQHLLEIITDILNFSRIEAGHTRYQLQPLRVVDVLERMEGVIEPQARARSLEYEYVEPDGALRVTADREKLEQVLINLLGNAVKFTRPGGRITLTADADDGHVLIRVRDTGVGIAKEQLASIFEPFVQLEPALTRTAEGTGLGLAISRELTRGMGGELRAESEPGRGSVFIVELPRV
ncbi:MAG: ATP-binding protein [Gemmatimonadaceae bacterium]